MNITYLRLFHMFLNTGCPTNFTCLQIVTLNNMLSLCIETQENQPKTTVNVYIFRNFLLSNIHSA